MTIQTDAIADLGRDQIITAAMRMCGILPPTEQATADEIAAGAIQFNIALLELQAEGVVLTSKVRTTLSLVAATAEYTLESDTIDVWCDGDDTVGTIISSDSGPETIVRAMSDGDYMKVATKSTQSGRPSRCYVDKGGNTVKLVFWPIPDSSDIDFRYTKVRLLRGNDTGASTLELRRTWIPCLMYLTASGIAYSNSKPELGVQFAGMAEDKRQRVRAQDIQRVTPRFRVGHSGRNW